MSTINHPPYPPSREDTTTEDTLPLRGVGGVIKKDIIKKNDI